MKLSALIWVALWWACMGSAAAQTKVDLRTQGKSVDFSGAALTKPFQTGTALPATCSVGQTFFKTDAPAGANLHACTATDAWSVVGAKDTPGGDVNGMLGSLTVARLQGRAVADATPADGSVLRWNDATRQWEPGAAAPAGTSPPATCSVGQTFFKTDAPAGANLYACTAANTWTPIGAKELPAVASYPGRVLSNDGLVSRWIDPAGDVSGSLSSMTVAKLQGRPVANMAPTDGNVLKWNGVSRRWEAASAVSAGTALPAACTLSEIFFKTDAPAGANLYACTGVNTWTAIGAKELPAVAGGQGKLLSTDGTTAQWVAPGGDVSGPLPSLTVSKLQGRAVTSATPAEGSVLRWNGSSNQWEPASAFPTGVALPATCTVGQNYIKTDAPPGENLYLCTAQDDWTPLGAKELPSRAGNAGKVLSNDGDATTWANPGGDVSGALSDLTVTKVQGKAVSSATPIEGNVLRWSSANERWETGAPGIPNYSRSFTAANSVVIPGSQHGLGTVNLVVTCYDEGAPAKMVEPDAVTVDPAGLDVLITFAAPQSGRCVVNGSGGTSSAPSSGGSTGGSIGNLEVGAGMLMIQTPDVTSLAVDSATVPTFLATSAVLSIPALGTGKCADGTLRIPGATEGDIVATGWPATLGGSMFGTMWVSSAGTVSVRVCNMATAASSPLTDYFKAMILRSF